MRFRRAIIAFLASLLATTAACGGKNESETPVPLRPPRPAAGTAGGPAEPDRHQVLLGEMCPAAAAGRPAVRPLFVGGQGWSDRAADVSGPVARHGARQFSVLGWEGRRAGLFSVAGAAQVDGGVAAIGAYAGRSPCEGPRGSGGATGAPDPECMAAQRGCGLAIAELEPAGGYRARPVGEEPDPVELLAGGACVAQEKLLVDIDRDGVPEAFPVAEFVDAAGAPAGEIGSVPPADASCSARFATRIGAAGASPRTGDLDIVGVADFDEDGRNEVVASFRQGARRTWALYQAVASAARLDRVALAMPWQGR